MTYYALGLVVAPGGIGTMDEIFEILTLLQTKKIDTQRMPIVMFGSYWRKVIDFEVMKSAGVIAQADIERLFFTDSVEDAFDHITQRLEEMEAAAEEAAVVEA